MSSQRVRLARYEKTRHQSCSGADQIAQTGNYARCVLGSCNMSFYGCLGLYHLQSNIVVSHHTGRDEAELHLRWHR